jgi:2-polyprenyl-6-methoxyphenol hydroxylase-like FAD-dependent oxidoreductase
MHGIVLSRLGHNVHILEQNETNERSALAAGINVGPRVQEFMKKYDLSGKPYTLPTGAQFINHNGVKRRLGLKLQMTSWDVIYYRLRANYDGFKSSYCTESYGDGRISIGTKVISVSESDKLVVTYQDSTGIGKLSADYVIAADGASSIIRQQFGLKPRTYSGYVAWRGVVPEDQISPKTKNLLDGNFSAFTMPNGYMVS